jgi:alpha-beta hydrolase superfamily lysophospholipase
MTKAAALCLAGLALLPGGCAGPQTIPTTAAQVSPGIEQDGTGTRVLLRARMPDGARLPLRVWAAPSSPRAVVLALHGFNDYGNAFAALGEQLAAEGISTYAVDQRGFGAGPLPGRWHGAERLADDVSVLLALLRQRHPEAPLFLLGESMGAAVAVVAAVRHRLPADGMVLIAPAVWARDTMPGYQRLALETIVRLLPGLVLTGQGVSIRPSDNMDMLRALGADPLVIKGARVDSLWGVTNLMDRALMAAPDLDRRSLGLPVLILYGERDSIIPPAAFCRFAAALPRGNDAPQVGLYRQGWHMLPRDLQGARVRNDIAAWLLDPDAPLPSGEEVRPHGRQMHTFCGRAGG